jgi:histone acetyltransferase
MAVLDRLFEETSSGVEAFMSPVSNKHAPGYSDIVTTPMDLGTIETKLEKREYQHAVCLDKYGHPWTAFAADMRLVWGNCLQYNEAVSEIGQCAIALSALFER